MLRGQLCVCVCVCVHGSKQTETPNRHTLLDTERVEEKEREKKNREKTTKQLAAAARTPQFYIYLSGGRFSLTLIHSPRLSLSISSGSIASHRIHNDHNWCCIFNRASKTRRDCSFRCLPISLTQTRSSEIPPPLEAFFFTFFY